MAFQLHVRRSVGVLFRQLCKTCGIPVASDDIRPAGVFFLDAAGHVAPDVEPYSVNVDGAQEFDGDCHLKSPGTVRSSRRDLPFHRRFRFPLRAVEL